MATKFPGIKNHIIVCGYGVVGQKIVDVIIEKNIPFVVIDIDEKSIEHAKELGYKTVLGDATLSKVLKDASVDTAKAIAVAMDNDAKNLFTVLTARDLNKHIFIATRANDDFVREKLVEAGADYIVMPQKSASKEIIKELTRES
jgi:voltage-gated potassium channel